MILKEKNFNINLNSRYYDRFVSSKIDLLFVIFFVFIQGTIWFLYTKNIKPDFTITPNPPSQTEKAFLSFGDNQLLYRIYAFQLQNAGDTFGETIPLKDYDYEKLEKWFYSLEELDEISDYVPSIAGFYYAQSQNPKDVIYVINYLKDHADKNPVKNWRWYSDAAYLANTKLHNHKLAVNLAQNILNINDKSIPAWARFMAIFLSEKTDDYCKTIQLIAQIPDSYIKDITEDKIFGPDDHERNFFLKLLLARAKKIESDPSIIKNCIDKKNKELQLIKKNNKL